MLTNLKETIKNSAVGKFTLTAFSNFIDYIHQKLFFGIFKRLDRKFIKFLFVGALNTAFGYFVYASCLALSANHNLALTFQYILGILWNFKTTGAIVFKNHNNHLIYRFFGCYIFTYFVNLLCLNGLVHLGFGKYISQAIMVLPVAILSFIILKAFVFREVKEINDANDEV